MEILNPLRAPHHLPAPARSARPITARAYRADTNPVCADDLPEADDLYDDFQGRAEFAQLRERHPESSRWVEDELRWR